MKARTVSDLKPWERNPRKISPEDLAALKRSLQEFGDLGGIVFNVRTKHVVGGHQRIKDLDPKWKIERRIAHDKTGTVAVGFIETPFGRVSYREVNWPQRREAAGNLAANKIQGEWDEPKLAELLAELKPFPEIQLTGFSQEEIDKLISEVMPAQVEEDQIPEPPVEPITKLGDVWQLGNHRIRCGDANELLANQETVDLILTDPPYGQSTELHFTHYGRTQLGSRTVRGDENLEDWLPQAAAHCYRLLKDDSTCLCFGQWRTVRPFLEAFENAGFRIRTVAIWDKKNAGLGGWNATGGGSGFGEQYEQIYVFYKGQPKTDWFRGNIFEQSRLSGRPEHPSQKPVELFVELMALFPSQTVLDPFLGSGTTLIAAEKLGRTCFGCEIEPQYVDLAVRRWEQFTGKKAIRIGG